MNWLNRFISQPLLLLMALLFSHAAWAGLPTFSASLNPSTTSPGGISTLTYTIDNSANNTPLSSASFSVSLPAGVTVASTPNLNNTCTDSTFTAVAGSSSANFSLTRMGTGISCTVSFNITSSTVTSHLIESSDLSTSAGTVTKASTTLTISASRPNLTMSLSPASITPGGVSTITYVIDNSQNGSNVTFNSFNHYFPSGVTLSGAPNPTSDAGCTAASLGTSNTDRFTVSVHTINAGATCTITVDVTASAVGTYALQTTNLQAGGQSGTAATATLTVTTAFMTMALPPTASPGQSVSLTYTLTNSDRNNDATNITFTNDLNATLSGLTATALPASGFCGAGSTASGSSTVTISGANLTSGSSCTFSITLLVPANAAAGNYSNTTSTINLTLGGATTKPAASNTLVVKKGPLVTMSFVESSIAAGSNASMRFTITNTDTVNAVSDILFTTDLNHQVASISVHTLPASNTCGSGSSFSQQVISDTLQFKVNGANLAAGANCQFDLVITVPDSAQPNTYTFTSAVPSATVSGSTVYGNTATANLTVAGGPQLSLAIVEDYTSPSATVTAQFTLNYNNNATADVTGVGFTVDLNTPFNGLVSTTAAQSDVCGSGSSFSGTSSLTLAGASLTAGGSCTFSVTLQIPSNAVAGLKTITSSAVTGTVSGTNVTSATASDTLTVSGLTFSHQYIGSPTMANQTVTLRYTISNDANALAATDIQFTHYLNQVMSSLTSTALPSTPCNGSSVLSGPTSLSLAAGELQPGQSCTFDVTVQIPAGANDGTYTSTTSNISATVNGNNTNNPSSSTTLTVESLSATLTTTAGTSTNTSPIPVAINFSRNVSGFALADLNVGNGSAGNLQGSGQSYTVDITPTADGAVTVDLPANVVTDAVYTGVQNPAASQLSVTYASTPATPKPGISIGSASAATTAGGPITYTVTYTNTTEINLIASNISLNKTGTANASVAVTNGTTTTPTVTLSSITGDGNAGLLHWRQFRP